MTTFNIGDQVSDGVRIGKVVRGLYRCGCHDHEVVDVDFAAGIILTLEVKYLTPAHTPEPEPESGCAIIFHPKMDVKQAICRRGPAWGDSYSWDRWLAGCVSEGYEVVPVPVGIAPEDFLWLLDPGLIDPDHDDIFTQ